MTAQAIVERLPHCRQTRKGQWIARCPSHDDKSPSLSISEASDGRILINCHAGCGALDVLTSLGLDWDDLFPEDDHYKPMFKRATGRSVDELVLEIGKASIDEGKRLSPEDKKRMLEAFVKTNRSAA